MIKTVVAELYYPYGDVRFEKDSTRFPLKFHLGIVAGWSRFNKNGRP